MQFKVQSFLTNYQEQQRMERPFPAYQGDDSYIFVCYSHADIETVYPELVWLKELGKEFIKEILIWLDRYLGPVN